MLLKRLVFNLVLLIFLNQNSYAQIGPHPVLQSYQGHDLNSLEIINSHPVLTKIIQKRSGIEFHRCSGDKTFVKWKHIEKINYGQNEYHFHVNFDGLNISLFYKPYPYEISDQRIHYGTIEAKGYHEDPNRITYFKVVFLEDLLMD